MGRRELSSLLLDTHTWAWILTRDRKLPERVTAIVESADEVRVSPISFFEIGQKVRLGKWPEMAPFLDELPRLLLDRGGAVAPLTDEIALRASTLDWGHRDPFDRLIAATAMAGGLELVSEDEVFDTLATAKGWRGRVW